MDIARYGLNRRRLFAALSNPCVQRGMGFSRDDVVEWQKLADHAGAFEGYLEADSDEGNVSGRFNWEWALKRLRLGLVADTLDGIKLEALGSESVEKFSEVVELLHRRLSALNGIRAKCSSENPEEWPDTWAGRLHSLMGDFLSAEKDDSPETLVKAGIVRTLNRLSRIEGEQGFRLPIAFVECSVSCIECAKGGYLRHGVTIGGLRSLAHVPFKYIFVIGLLEGAIPGKNDHSTLDVRNELPEGERKDTLRAAKSRAQFMAAVSSARKELVLSYPCFDLQSDATLYPSSLVREVAEGVAEEHYPLESALQNVPDAVADPVQGREADKRSSEEPSVKDLAAFVKDPYNGVFSRRFKIASEQWRSTSIDAETPLGVPYGSTKWDLEKAMMLHELDSEYAKSQKVARIPLSYLGEYAKKKTAKQQDWADENVMEEDRKLLREEAKEDGFALLCRNYTSTTKGAGENVPIKIPPSVVLEPFYGFLVKHVESKARKDLEFKIKVIAFNNIVQTWLWTIPHDEVLDHIAKVRELYGTIPRAVSYDNLREKLIDIARVPNDETSQAFWGKIARGIQPSGAKLVVDKVLDRWRRPPTGDELKDMYRQMFKLPMSGELEA